MRTFAVLAFSRLYINCHHWYRGGLSACRAEEEMDVNPFAAQRDRGRREEEAEGRQSAPKRPHASRSGEMRGRSSQSRSTVSDRQESKASDEEE